MSKRATYAFLAALAAFAAAWMFVVVRDGRVQAAQEDLPDRFFAVQSIDTMKHSRDLARERLSDPSFDAEIDAQMRAIAESGATHAALGTPYDAEFAPFLERWVVAAHRHGLSVWFRGNFSGWEGWFGYARIGEDEHRRLLEGFLERESYLFEDGDVFSPCPECENGGPGDPRSNGRAVAYSDFLQSEYAISRAAFSRMGKAVSIYPSMNADVARDALRPSDAARIGGTVLVDHYVKAPDALARDASYIRERLGADVGIGEFGAPIPDIHGQMSEGQQAEFVDRALAGLVAAGEEVPAVNYWVLKGGSTALVGDDGTRRAAYGALAAYYSPRVVSGTVADEGGGPVSGAAVSIEGIGERGTTARDGSYRILAPTKDVVLSFRKAGYEDGWAASGAASSSGADATMRRAERRGAWEWVADWMRI